MLRELVIEMGRDHRAGIDDEIALPGRGIGIARRDPHRVEPEGRILGLLARKLAHRLPGIEREHLVGRDAVLGDDDAADDDAIRSEEHTSELQSLMRTSYAVFCLKK